MFYLDKDMPLTEQHIIKYIEKFRSDTLPRLQKWRNYYDGDQDIKHRIISDSTKPNNKIVANYASDITDNYCGYLTGRPVTYSCNEDIAGIMDVLRANNATTEDKCLLKDALIYGTAYELHYINAAGEECFKTISPESGFPIYSADLDRTLLYFVRYYSVEDVVANKSTCYVELYSANSVARYKTNDQYSELAPIEIRAHYFGEVPVAVMEMGDDNRAIFDGIISLQDAYNTIISDRTNDYEVFCDAYMVLSGVLADEETLKQMKENRILQLDGDASASYLTKQVAPAEVDSLLDKLNRHIRRISHSPDFTDENFFAQSGVSLAYKLIAFEDTSANIEAHMKAAIKRRLTLICNIAKLTSDTFAVGDIDITVARNLPVDVLTTAQAVNQLRGLVSNKTLLTQLPFIDDPEAECEAAKADTESTLYNFSGGDSNGDNK